MKKFSLQFLYTSITRYNTRTNAVKIFFTVFLLCLGLSGSAQSWNNVGAPGFSAGSANFTSIAIDGTGAPYVVFEDGANSNNATVEKYNGTGWVIIGAPGFSSGVVQSSSIAIDGAGTPYVVYEDGGSANSASVMKYNGSSWVYVGARGFSAGNVLYTSMAIDGSGTPYVAYYDAANGGKETVMKFNGSSWVTVGAVGFSAGGAFYSHIAIDGAGTPYVTYQDVAFGGATVMKYNGSSWVAVGTPGFAPSASLPTIAIDPSGTPYVAYQESSMSDKTTVMKFDGSSWVYVGSRGFTAINAEYISIAIDGSGTPYVAYTDGVSGPANVMKFNGSGWINFGVADFSAGTTSFTNIVLNASGTPFVVYRDGANSNHATVKSPGPGALGTPITGASTVCVGDSITLSDATTGGTWTSSDATIATVGSLSGIVTGVAMGTTTITYIVSSDTATDVITVYPRPTSYVTTGGGSACSGGGGVFVVLNNSDIGVNYQLVLVGTGFVGASTGGTGASISFGPVFVSGTYKIIATSSTLPCADTMLGAALVTINPSPSVFAVTGGGSYCIGSPCPHIGLAGSSPGINYSVYCGGTLVVGPVTGTGSPIDFGTFCDSCNYSVSGTDATTGCQTLMGFARVSILGSITPISGSPIVCIGLTTALTDGATGGIWTSSRTSVATVGSATGIVTGVSAGTTMITYTLGACTATIVITVPTGAGAPITYHDLCQNTSEIIHDIDTGGYWSSTYVTVANLGSGSALLTADDPGIGSITYTLPSGCTIIDTIMVNPNPVITTLDRTICVGSSISYSSSIGGGTWSSSNTGVALIGTSTGIIFGVSTGSAIITNTLGTGCRDTTLIFVNPLPAAITSASGMSVCFGDSLSLSDASAGGTWASGNTFVATVNVSSGEVFGENPGSAVITYTLPTGCLTTTTITVNAPPTTITGPASVCVGSSITLFDGTSGGEWISGVSSVATIGSATGILTGVSFGTTTITYFSGAGCYSTFGVTVDSLPSVITGPDSVCVLGPSIHLISSPGGGTWSSSSSVASVDGVGFVTAAGPLSGSAIITYTLPTGCYVTTTITVSPAPDPISGSTTICVGGTSTLSDGVAGGSWVSNSLSVATIGTSGVVTGIGVGSAIISYVLPTGCLVLTSVDVTPVPGPIHGRATICLGFGETLTDSVAGGIWTSSNQSIMTIGSTSGVVTSVAVGESIITYRLGSCFVTLSIAISPFGVIYGPDSVCVGSTIELKDTGIVVGGVWTSTGPVTLSSSRDSTYVMGVAAGTAIITYTFDSCMATYVVTIDSTPVLFPRSMSICVGDSATLFATIAGGAWSNSNTSFDTLRPFPPSSAEVYGIAGYGTSVIGYTLARGGCSAFTTVTVNPLPIAITPPPTDSVCQGSSLLFSDFGTGTWSISPGTVASIGSSTGNVIGLSGGTAVITYTLGTGCFVTDTVRVDSLGPINGHLHICIGDSTAYTDYPIAGTWSDDNPAVGTIDPTSGMFTSLDTGSTIITYMTPTGCAAYLSVTVDPLPAPITGPDSVCVNSVITLMDVDTGGIWTSGNVSVAQAFAGGNVQGIGPGGVPGTAIITYTLPTTCYTTKAVTVNPLPANIAGNLNICLTHTDSTFLTDATPGGVWSSNNPAVGSITPGGLVYAVGVGSLVITYTLPTGCATTANVIIHPPPVITVSSHREICIGGSDTLSLSGAGFGGSYKWSPAYGLSTTVGTPVIANPTVTVTYTITATTSWGCYSDTTTTVLVDSLLRFLKVVGKDSICIGTCDSLRGSGRDLTFLSWKPAVGLSCTICDSPIACPTTTEVYTATAVDVYGCRDSTTFKVTVNPLPSLSVFENPAIVCRGTPKQLLAFGADYYFWSPPYFLSCDTCSNPIATDTANLIYELTGVTKFGCRDSISVRVSVLDTNINRAGDDTIICIGGSAKLFAYSHSVTGNLDVPQYEWFDRNSQGFTAATGLDNPNSPDPIATPDTTTQYVVVIKENQCFSDTIPVLVTVDQLPVIKIAANPANHLVIAGTAVQITTTVTVDTPSTYLWTPAISLSCDDCPNPIATPSVNTLYNVIVTSNHGCVSSDTVSINIICDGTEVFIPNTFTPNGDGVNDIFYVSSKGITLITRMSVYNRWGQCVFQANNIPPDMPGYGWDGTFKGIVVEPDAFDYVVDVVCELGQTYHYVGSISIVR